MRRVKDAARRIAKAARLMREPKYRRGLRYGIAAAIEHKVLLAPLGVTTVIDIGANHGQFSLLCWQVFPDAKIYAFEPQSRPADRFVTLFDGNSCACLFRAAVSTRAGLVEMHVSRRDDNSSLLPISQTMTEIFPGTDETGTVQVESGPLTQFVAAKDIIEPALLKLDVQGSELDTLLACDDVLARVQYVYVELSFIELYRGQALFAEVVRHLDSRGYDLCGIDNIARDRAGKPVQADCLFARRIAVQLQRQLDSTFEDKSRDLHRTPPAA